MTRETKKEREEHERFKQSAFKFMNEFNRNKKMERLRKQACELESINDTIIKIRIKSKAKGIGVNNN